MDVKEKNQRINKQSEYIEGLKKQCLEKKFIQEMHK